MNRKSRPKLERIRERGFGALRAPHSTEEGIPSGAGWYVNEHFIAELSPLKGIAEKPVTFLVGRALKAERRQPATGTEWIYGVKRAGRLSPSWRSSETFKIINLVGRPIYPRSEHGKPLAFGHRADKSHDLINSCFQAAQWVLKQDQPTREMWQIYSLIQRRSGQGHEGGRR
ncbi:hypothetical protein YH63_016515 [Afipia massiliensis]|uniref:Uncharacterized protein n=1 Tax=Afipia massiliensis TaxID=211460 RepID=A0A4U6BUQ3_9BRAD|nr:hypothetical protein [Afipia massiliensis]TKT72898.1 hypothetical protein YH63_016515 [Afipia massiliensis]